MRFIEYSFESLENDSKRLAQIVRADGVAPDCVAYLARGGWLIGKAVADELGVPLLELSSQRTGETMKLGLSPILSRLPKWFRKYLRERELSVRFRPENEAREIKDVRITRRYLINDSYRSILLVDDSADTGMTIKSAVSLLSKRFPDAAVHVGVINAFSNCRCKDILDWVLGWDCVLSLPSSKDSKYYRIFKDMYEQN